MTLKEILAKIKTMWADAPAEVTSMLADADRQIADMTESLSSANKESATRKTRIRELEAELETTKQDLTKAQSPEAKAEIDRLKKIEADHQSLLAEADAKLKAEWADKQARLTVDKTHKSYDRIQGVISDFALPEEGKDLTVDQIKGNLKAFALLEKAKFFDAEPAKDTGGNPPQPNNIQQAANATYADILNYTKK